MQENSPDEKWKKKHARHYSTLLHPFPIFPLSGMNRQTN